MNVKNNIKKIFAIAAGVALVGTTFVGALAYDLSDYPAPFVQDGMASGTIVVGANAATADVLGAIDIAASLQAEAVTGTAISGSATVAVSGGEVIDNVPLNAEIAGDYTESDIDGLIDGTVRWNSQTYDVYEEITVGDTYIQTYYPGGAFGPDDFESDPFMVVDTAGTIMYSYVFDEAIDATGATGFDDKPLEIKFLGRTLSISAIDAGEMTVESSSDFYMEEGDTVTVGGHDVTLKKVGSTSVLVTVDGQTLAIGDGDSDEFDQADYFEVEVASMFYIEGATDNSATLTLGETLVDDVEDDDPMELYGESDDEDEAEWFWTIDVTGDGDIQVGDSIIAYQGMVRTEKDVSGADERPALGLGESLDFPNNYASIEFVGFESSAMTDYEDLTIEPASVKIGGVYVDVMEISTSASKDSFFVYDDGTYVDKSSKIYVAADGVAGQVNIYDADKEELLMDAIEADDTIVLELDEATYTIAPIGDAWTITDDTGDIFTLNIPDTLDHFGATADAEAGDVDFEGEDISENDDPSWRTTNGIIVEDMEAQMDNDKFSIEVPTETQLPVVVVKSEGTVVSAGADGMSYMVNPIDVGFGILDSDAGAFGTTPMIIVGGPAANTVAAEFLGNPTQEELMATFSEGKALIMYDDVKMAMLVAGWDKLETQGACYVVADYTNSAWASKFVGTELEVVVTDLQNLVVNTVE